MKYVVRRDRPHPGAGRVLRGIAEGGLWPVPTLSLTFFFTNLVKIGLYWRYGLITGATWAADARLAPVVLLGSTVGVAANRRLSRRAFENAVLGFALLAGARLLVW